MVQILEDNSPSAQRKAAFSGLSTEIKSGIEKFKQEMNDRKDREELAKRFGNEFKNVKNPDLQKLMLQGALQREKNSQDESLNLPDYETVKAQFGDKFANLYRAAPIGGKTELLRTGLDALVRGENIKDMLNEVDESQINPNEMPANSQQRIDGEDNLPDFTKRPKGYNRQEWAKEISGWTKNNTETLDKTRDRLRGNKRDLLGTQKLQKLNESRALPEGLDRFIINPSTGEPYKLAQLTGKVPVAAQEWIKEIARFGNRAKDAFGSRVTNFDLLQYMKQFPSLMNTPEGRRNILKMMEINYKLDSLYDNAIQQIIDKKGAGNIPPDQADKIARNMIKDQEEQLHNEYLNLEEQNDSAFINDDSERPSLEEIFGD